MFVSDFVGQKLLEQRSQQFGAYGQVMQARANNFSANSCILSLICSIKYNWNSDKNSTFATPLISQCNET